MDSSSSCCSERPLRKQKSLERPNFCLFFCKFVFSLLQISLFSQCRGSVRTLHIYTFAILVLFIFWQAPCVYEDSSLWDTNKQIPFIFIDCPELACTFTKLWFSDGRQGHRHTRTCLSSPDLLPLEPIKKCIKGLPSHLICSSDCYPFKTSVYCRRV